MRSRGQLGAEVAVQHLEALQVGPMTAREALPRLRQPLLGARQAGLIPQLEEAPAFHATQFQECFSREMSQPPTV